MSDFKAKMHQIRFRLGLRPSPHTPLGELTALPDHQLDLKGLLLRGGREGEGPTYKEREVKWARGGDEGEWKGREKDGRGGEGKWRGLLIRGGRWREWRGGERRKGRGRVPPPVITVSPHHNHTTPFWESCGVGVVWPHHNFFQKSVVWVWCVSWFGRRLSLGHRKYDLLDYFLWDVNNRLTISVTRQRSKSAWSYSINQYLFTTSFNHYVYCYFFSLFRPDFSGYFLTYFYSISLAGALLRC